MGYDIGCLMTRGLEIDTETDIDIHIDDEEEEEAAPQPQQPQQQQQQLLLQQQQQQEEEEEEEEEDEDDNEELSSPLEVIMSKATTRYMTRNRKLLEQLPFSFTFFNNHKESSCSKMENINNNKNNNTNNKNNNNNNNNNSSHNKIHREKKSKKETRRERRRDRRRREEEIDQERDNLSKLLLFKFFNQHEFMSYFSTVLEEVLEKRSNR